MAEEGKQAEAAAIDKKANKKGAKEETIGKFVHGDHMVHILFQKGKKFIAADEEAR